MSPKIEKKYNKIKIDIEDLNEGSVDTSKQVNELIDTSSWYKKTIQNSGSRSEKSERYHFMDENTTKISKALDILADEISSQNIDVPDPFVINFGENKKVRVRDIKNLQKMKDIWLKRTQFDYRMFEFIRETLKYGFKAFYKKRDGTLTELFMQRFVGYVLDPVDESLITHYIYDVSKCEADDTIMANNRDSSSTKKNHRYIPLEDMIIFKIGEGPYGESVLNKVYSMWRKMQLLEDAVVIHRVNTAPERKIFKIDVGELPVHKAEQVINKMKIQHRQKQIMKQGQLDSNFDPMSMTENYWLPQWGSSGRGSSIDTVGGQRNDDGLNDLKYFSKELASGLKIPHGLLAMHDKDSGGGVQFNEQRVENILSEEIRFINYVFRIQKYFNSVLEEEFIKFCQKRDIVIPDDFSFYLCPPTSLEYYQTANKFQLGLNLIQSSSQADSLSEKFKLEKLLQLDSEQIKRNEEYKLLEMGVSKETLKKGIPDEDIHGLVYGNVSSIKEKYGVKDSESDGGRRW